MTLAYKGLSSWHLMLPSFRAVMVRVMWTEDEDKLVICWSNAIPAAWPHSPGCHSQAGMRVAGLGLTGTKSWNPHIWLISVAYGHLIFGWWLPVVTQRLDCSEGSRLFFSTQDWRRWPQLGLLFADAASAPQGLETGRRCAQPTQWGHQPLIDHSSSYCQKRFYIKLFSCCPPHFDLRQLWCSNNWTDFMESNCCVGLRPSSIALVHSTSSDPFFPVFSAVHCRADNWVQLQVKLFAWQWANQSWIGSEQAVFP